MCFFHYTNHNQHTGMGINGDVQHKLMSLHVSSIETLNKPAHIFVYFFFFSLLFCWFEKKKSERDAKRTEENAQRGRSEPNVSLVLTTAGFICLLMICVVERGTKAAMSCQVLFKPTHMVIVQLISVIQGLDKKNCQLVT